MKKWICSICSYVYDETIGDPDGGIAPGTKWEDIPDDWSCPVCGASKSDFEEYQENVQSSSNTAAAVEDDQEDLRDLSFGELSALCSNLSKGCAKQYRPEEADLFNQLSEFYKSKTESFDKDQLNDIAELINEDLNSAYPQANTTASAAKDRGALRALVWGEKVTKILKSFLARYEKQSDSLLEGSNVYVCGICGFIYVGNDLPEVCPVCKVPNRKFTQIERGVK